MSEPKHISPLLDGFAMGNPMSDHDGVRCCPAIKENSENKYIVKIISIPSTQVQMDALLLAGAYKDASGAMDYFKTVVDDVFKEAELLKKLSKLDGFLSYEGWQMEPITRRRLGYEVYLLGEYRRSLDKFVRKNPITQLEAINLGLDMCSALSVCRQAGALYVDLKPTNIFVSDKKEYRIGDLGFVSLDALNYTALPDKYRSPYTAPELLDPMASVNLTTDTYALGMILYQIYNDGQLPPQQEEGDLPAPVHADYELAEIILKAIAKNPEDRWQDPKDMGQALVGYMQRNVVNDVPITPYVPLEENPEEEANDAPAEEPCPADPPAEAPDVQDAPKDETQPGEEDADTLLPHEMSDELSRMMEKADDLIAHEPPEGVVVPEIPEIPDPFAFATEDSVEAADAQIPLDPVMEEESEETPPKKKAGSFASQAGKLRRKKFFSKVLLLCLAALICFGFFWTYQNLYLQTVDNLSITGSRSQLTVTVDSQINESLLSVTCADRNGNLETREVKNGQASFTGLQPNTAYTISLEIAGFHRLVGQTSEVFTTDTTTRIVSFSAVAGTEDGTLILNFTVDGEEPDQWVLTYAAPGEEEKHKTFTGHSVAVEMLKVGKVYTFTLDAGKDISLGGKTSLEIMASRLILAEDFTISSDGGTDVTIRWRAPGDIMVDSWKVRCYNDSGYEQELTVQDTEATFSGIDPAAAYTIEVTAAGMTQSSRTGITADPVNITAFRAEPEGDEKLNIRWDYTGETPEGGWLLLYSVNGSKIPDVIKSDHASVTLASHVPDARYSFTILAADGKSVLSNVHTYSTGSAPAYDANGLTASDVTARLVKTPDQKNWRTEQLDEDAFRSEFTAGDPISMTLESAVTFYHPGDEVDVLYLIRDAQGTVLADWTAHEKRVWREIWEGGDSRNAELEIPKLPGYPGQFSVTVLIDGMLLGQAEFTLTR